MKRFLLSWFLCGALFGQGTDSYAADQTPTLVVVVSVDQLAYEYLERFRRGFDERGIFRRIEREGAWFTNCHHRHGVTTTGPGHSVQLTGAYPSTNGIVDNGWIDRATGKQVYCVADPSAHLVGPIAGDPPVSPRNLLADTLGDRLKIVTGSRSKVFGVAIKDRASILMTGHAADGAFWISDGGKWITSDYYRKELPAYLRSWNASDASLRLAGRSWELLYDRSRYRHSPTEDTFGERPLPGMTADFPHKMPDAGAKNYIRLVSYSPFGIEITLEGARLIVADEKLGQDEFPDLLLINLSSNDYVGHTFGPESLEVEDITYRTDLMLGEFVDFINERMEGRPWLFVLTADHGVAPIPERTARLKIAARRNPVTSDGKEGPGTTHQMLEALLRAKLGVKDSQPSLVLAVIESQIYLRQDHPALKGTAFAEAQRLTRDWLLAQPSVAAAITREQILSGCVNGALETALRLSFHPRRSGDVLFCLEPYDIQGNVAATHGSPWDYDTHVPLLVLEPGNTPRSTRIPAGRYHRRVSPASIAPTLAQLLHVPPPGGCVEEPLYELLPDSPNEGGNPR
ncbi:MAG TPA: alkaline phosphatase family protein [Planctomycetaceae bacterium]|nr:alkaline phosphatase family protein [Planctomycetaceae bacterium]